jgi:hypothetical protein
MGPPSLPLSPLWWGRAPGLALVRLLLPLAIAVGGMGSQPACPTGTTASPLALHCTGVASPALAPLCASACPLCGGLSTASLSAARGLEWELGAALPSLAPGGPSTLVAFAGVPALWLALAEGTPLERVPASSTFTAAVNGVGAAVLAGPVPIGGCGACFEVASAAPPNG